MPACACRWLVFLVLVKNFPCNRPNPFQLEGRELTATEGSCVEIKCTVLRNVDFDGHWFWMKDPVYVDSDKKYVSTVIYSTGESQGPDKDFANRVKYVGSPAENWRKAYSSSPKPLCSIQICDLITADSGRYAFRFEGEAGGSHTWITKPCMLLTVHANPCPITFNEPSPVIENHPITLECSTVASCSQHLKMDTQLVSNLPTKSRMTKSITYSFKTTREHDGRVFSCQTEKNSDSYLVRNVSVTVEYAPKDALATISSGNVMEGHSVTLTCSAKGQPNLRFTWFKDNQEQSSEANWTIPSIQDSQSGSYYCKAQNTHGVKASNMVVISVTYVPDVDIQVSPVPEGGLKEGDSVTLTCNVKRSKPQPQTFTWFKDGTDFVNSQTYIVDRLKPENSGSYQCAASNTVGLGSRTSYHLQVQYKPRNTSVSTYGATSVSVNSPLTFECSTVAYPAPWRYSWYRYNVTDSSQWTPVGENKILQLLKVQRADEACYMCNATNIIDKGDMSGPMCIEVLFPPTKVMLDMDTEVIEGQPVTVTCTAESSPTSHFTLTKSPSPSSPAWSTPRPANRQNTFRHKFTAKSTHAGFYTCEASNGEGRNTSLQRKLVVKYTPKEVKVNALPGLVVNENKPFTLSCSADSFPPVTSVKWMKMTSGKTEYIPTTERTLSFESASPSDSGPYSCSVTNDIGTGRSQQVAVTVKYGPKHVTIIKGPEQQQRDGKRFVLLRCSSHCNPPVTQYSWYKKADKGDVRQSNTENITVYSDQLGEYYCTAKNEMSSKMSDPIRPFDDSTMQAVKLFFSLCFILLILVLMVFLYRRWRNKSIQRGTTNARPCCGFLRWCDGTRRRNRINGTRLVEPSRSRDDLLANQPRRPKAQQCQPRPDSTPASNVNSVYATVNLPQGKQAPSAQKPMRQHGGHVEDDSLNYASLHFGERQKKPEEDVYAKVSQPNSSKEKEQQRLEDYENVNTACAAKLPYPYDYDSDTSTSDGEVDVNYSEVNFKPKAGQQRAKKRSSSSEDETQYSEIKL